MIGIGIGIGKSKVIDTGGLNPATLDWESWVIANGGSIDPAVLQIFNDEFFQPADDNGNILTELDRLNIYAGTGNQIASRTNVIKNAHYVTPVSSPTFNNDGYKSSGTSYLNLNYNILTQGIKFTRNNACYGYFVKNPQHAAAFRPMGSFGGGGCRNDCERDTDGGVGSINTSGAVRNTNEFTSGIINWHFERSDATNITVEANATSVTGAAASAALVSEDVYELCLNLSGSPFGPFDTESHCASYHGSADLDIVALRSILQNLFTALGV